MIHLILMNWQEESLLVLRAILAGALGALVGWQRQHTGQEAGIRTFSAVALGACVFSLINPSDARSAAQVISGVGFLGAGIILRGRTHIDGLTTAAAMWATASIGTAVAYGHFLAGVAIAIVLVGILASSSRRPERPKGKSAAAARSPNGGES
jgi:putative Mg2+ transporter-C (MgtC) family protein